MHDLAIKIDRIRKDSGFEDFSGLFKEYNSAQDGLLTKTDVHKLMIACRLTEATDAEAEFAMKMISHFKQKIDLLSFTEWIGVMV